jgi:hypothetical protein
MRLLTGGTFGIVGKLIQHHDACADFNALVEIDNVLVQEPEASDQGCLAN